MLPNKKIIAFDLDGTLAVSKSPVTEEMVNLLKELIRQTKVVVISGGWFKQFDTQFLVQFNDGDFLSSFGENLILLPTSGSQRWEYNKTKKEWYITDREPMDENTKIKAIELLNEIIISPIYEIPKNPIGEIIEDRDTQITFTPNGQFAPIEIKRLFDPDRKKREKIRSVIAPQLPEVSILINGSSSIDIVPKDFTKAVGLKRLLNKLNMTIDDMIFVGDAIFPGGNDYSAYLAGIETIQVSGPQETAIIIRNWVAQKLV